MNFWYLQKPDEGDVSSGTGTVDICELPHGCWAGTSGTRQDELKVCVTIHGTGSCLLTSYQEYTLGVRRALHK